MIIRVVRLTLHPDRVNDFISLFNQSAPTIRGFAGCRHLELWVDVSFPNIVTSYSHWDSDTDLQTYRASAFFKKTWASVTPMFAAPATAHSYKRDGDQKEN